MLQAGEEARRRVVIRIRRIFLFVMITFILHQDWPPTRGIIRLTWEKRPNGSGACPEIYEGLPTGGGGQGSV